MIFSLALAILISLAIGTAAVHLAWPRLTSSFPHRIVAASLGFGLGISAFSCAYFLWLTLSGSQGGFAMFATISGVSLLAIVAGRLIRRPRPIALQTSHAPKRNSAIIRVVAVAFCVAAIAAFATWIVLLLREPNGQYDATAIWNLHARFLFRGGHNWTDYLSSFLFWSHPDYPLLLPGAIAGLWNFTGNETSPAPALLAMLFTLSTLVLLVSSVSVLRSRTQGYLAGLVLLAVFLFTTTGISEYADTPLGYFLLAVLVLFSLHDTEVIGNPGLVLLAGLMAGFAAWTKNEGLLFVVSIVVARFAVTVPSKGLRLYLRQMFYFSIGLVPVLLILIYFKLRFAPPNDLVASQDIQTITQKILDPARYLLIFKALVNQFIGFRKWYTHPAYLLLVYPFFVGIRTRIRDSAGPASSAVALGLILIGYLFVYVTTPHDLQWHLSFSLGRLLIQLWPAFVFLYFLAVRTPEEALAPIESVGKGETY
jgi:hypothetical protein